MNAYDFILETERETLRFYENLARRAEQAGIRKIFAMMAEDERQLCATLEGWRTRAGTELGDSPGLESLRAAAPGHYDEAAVLQALSGDLDAYRFVMQMDEERAQLYEAAALGETDENARELLRAAAVQDHRHHDGVESVFDFVSAPQYHLAWREFSNLSEFRNFGRDPW